MTEEKHKHQEVEEKNTEHSPAPNETKAEAKETKKDHKSHEKVKKDKAIVNVKNIKISLKHAIAICRVIKKKHIGDAISILEGVTRKEIAVPMKGELPHRKGIMSGRYPLKASKEIIKILKSLMANAITNGLDMDEVIISEAIPNTGGKATASKKGKRIHLTFIAKEKNKSEKKK